MGAALAWIVIFGGAIGLAWSLRRRGRCPRCAERALRWTHARVDGRRDLRFAVNPRYCGACGWSEGAALEPDDGLASLPASSVAGAPVAVPLDVDPAETDPVMKQVEAAAIRLHEQERFSARRKTVERARRVAADHPRASDELEQLIATAEVHFAKRAVIDGAELQAEQEILRERLVELGVPADIIRRKLDELARISR